MGDPFWDPIFERCKGDLPLLTQIALDTPDDILTSLARPNQPLLRQCSPFMKGGKITKKELFVEYLVRFASKEESLRRVLFFGWIQSNPSTMKFSTVPIDEASLQKLKAGDFGKPRKIAILSRIDTREAAMPIFQAFLADAAPSRTPSESVSPTDGVDTQTAPGWRVFSGVSSPASTSLPQSPAEADLASLRQLEREKNELVQIVEKMRDENKILRRNIKNLEEKEKGFQSKLSGRGEELQTAKQALEKERAEIQLLKQRISDFQARETILSTTIGKPSAVDSEMMDNLRELNKRVETLEEVISRRDALIEKQKVRLQDNLKDLSVFQEQFKQLERQTQIIKQMEDSIENTKNLKVGRLIAKNPDGDSGKPNWLFEFISGERQSIEGPFSLSGNISDGEWVIVLYDKENHIYKITSLEEPRKKEIIGMLVERDSQWLLDSEDESIPVYCSREQLEPDIVISGIFLPTFADRPGGIYSLRKLSTTGQEKTVRTTASFEIIQKFFHLAVFDREKFVSWLSAQDATFKIKSDGIDFGKDYRSVLGGLRTRIPARIVCEKEICRSQLGMNEFARKRSGDEICSVCLEEIESGNEAGVRYDFKGARALIVGGDFVGGKYREIFEQHNLQIKWISGFESLGGLGSGLGGVDLVVVVIKQVSHTILREIISAAKSAKTTILFSQKRGVSGLLSLLVDFLKPSKI